MAITDAQQARQMYYAGGSPADTHNQPGGSGGAPDSVTGGDNDYYDPRFQTVVSQSPSQIGRGPYDDTQSNRLSNFIDKVGGGIGNVSNYYTNSANQKGILGTLLGSMFFGPLGGILGGMYGRGMFKNPFTVQTDESITQDSNLIDQRFMGSMGVTPQILPQKKPIQLGTPPYTNIEPLMAKQLTIPFDYSNLGDPYKDNYYDQNGNYIGPTVTG